jgi:ribonuclease HII
MTKETLEYDDALRTAYPIIVGCDEVGRGCLAGPIVTAAVILPYGVDIEGVKDSKKINKKNHEALARLIFEKAIEVQIGIKSSNEIDDMNILEADKEAMRDSIIKLHTIPDLILIDGDNKQLLGTEYPEQTIIKGDAKSLTIGAASIIAKYTRDRLMQKYALQYPGYGFETNAGYGTAQHIAAIKRLGITPVHRLTFEPIKRNQNNWPYNPGIGGQNDTR